MELIVEFKLLTTSIQLQRTVKTDHRILAIMNALHVYVHKYSFIFILSYNNLFNE